MKKTFGIFLLFFIFLLLSSNYVSAQQISLSISPPITQILTKPGKTVEIYIKIANLGDPTNFSAQVVPIVPGRNNKAWQIKPELENPLSFSLINSDFTLGDSFFLRTKETKTLILQIQIPQNTTEGDYYYTFLVQSNKPTPLDGTTTGTLTGAVGSNILIGVSQSGLTDVMGKITLFKTVASHSFSLFGKKIEFIDSTDPVNLILEVANTGKNIITPQGNIVLHGPLGETANYDIIQKDILAYSQDTLSATPSANPNESSTLTLQGFFVGKYDLSTTINFGPGSGNMFGNTSFFAIPIKFILILLALSIVGFFILKKIKS